MTRNTTTALEQLHKELLKDVVESIWNIKPQRLIRLQRYFSMFQSFKNTLKILSVLSLALLTTFFLKPDVALASGFNKTCSNLKLDTDSAHAYLTATCLNTNGQKVDSQLDLNKYIANHNGRIVWSPGEGGFLKTCAYEGTHLNGRSVLRVPYPERDDGSLHLYEDDIELNDYISNQEGILTPDPLK